MQAGDLVRIKRASIGVPRNTLALIIKVQNALDCNDEPFSLYRVTMSVSKSARSQPYERQYIGEDLEVVSASR